MIVHNFSTFFEASCSLLPEK